MVMALLSPFAHNIVFCFTNPQPQPRTLNFPSFCCRYRENSLSLGLFIGVSCDLKTHYQGAFFRAVKGMSQANLDLDKYNQKTSVSQISVDMPTFPKETSLKGGYFGFRGFCAWLFGSIDMW